MFHDELRLVVDRATLYFDARETFASSVKCVILRIIYSGIDEFNIFLASHIKSSNPETEKTLYFYADHMILLVIRPYFNVHFVHVSPVVY